MPTPLAPDGPGRVPVLRVPLRGRLEVLRTVPRDGLGRVDVREASESDEPGGQVEHAQEHRPPLLVPRRYPAELLELAEQPLHTVPLPVRLRVERPRVDPVRLVRDDRADVPVDARVPLRVAVERPVGDQLVDRAHPVEGPVEQRLQERGLARLPGDHVDGQGGVLVGGRQDDLGRPPAPALADRLRPHRPLGTDLFFFRRAPAACWWARTMVASISTRRTSPRSGSAVSSSNRAWRLPEYTHRRSRLYTASQDPNSAGRSRHGTPVLAQYRTASKNTRSGVSGFCPALCRLARSTSGPMTAQSSSVSMYRMAIPHRSGREHTPSRCAAKTGNVNRT